MDQQGASSEVLLKNVLIDKGISCQNYGLPSFISTGQPVQIGDPIWLITGTVQNQHPEYNYIAIWANGYDDKGNMVAVTLDSAHIVGQILLYLENGETGTFTLHLNMASNLKSVHIFAHSYAMMPP
ncbi:hypothetical protein DGWBC_1794 [Dehalogenimonas sp. WBC-2]|nr:hypothetical protein DGWBC_1794 [Dehalogenimonas sp. WBC-2]